jgi:DNA (cytosine-5)-methyltransferase 1
MNGQPLRYLSLFSGIGGFDLGFDRAGMVCAGQVEFDEKARAVLAKHWPDVPRLNDVREVNGDEFGSIDLICGGFPCQDVSVAGRRAGLAGERSGLWHEFHRLIDRVKPRVVAIENVPGLLSSNGGRDFATVLRGLVECGYGVAWRILDAQYFGVPQRRRRVFIVGSLGDGRAAEILFEREGGGGGVAPRRGQGSDIARDVATSLRHGGGNGRGYNLDAEAGLTVAPFDLAQITSRVNRTTVNAGGPAWPLNTSAQAHIAYVTTHALTAEGHDASEDGTGRGVPILAAPLVARQAKGGFTDPVNDNIICTTFNGYTGGADDNDAQGGHLDMAFSAGNSGDSYGIGLTENGTPPLRAGNSGTNMTPTVAGGFGVRRLTPVECERLQGFPDNWTDGQSDSARYRQLGNAVAVPVAEWLGWRIVAAKQQEKPQ